jgi:hypothetical protein
MRRRPRKRSRRRNTVICSHYRTVRAGIVHRAWRRIEKPNPQFTKGETERFLLAEPGDVGDRLRLGKH